MGILTKSVLRAVGASPENPSTNLGDPSQWLIDWMGGRDTASGISMSQERAMRNATVFRCVSLIADQISSVPWEMFKLLPDGSREKATSHPTRRLLHDGPNVMMTSSTYRRLIMADVLSLGNLYSVINRTSGRPSELLYLPASTVKVERKNGRLKYDVNLADGTHEEIDQVDMIHVPGLGFDGIVGMSVIAAQAEPIALGLGMENYVARLHRNATMAKGAVEIPGHLKPETWKKLLDGIQKIMTGDGLAIPLDQGMKWQNLVMTPSDAQTLEQRKYQAIDICKIFGVPPQMIGESDSNVEWGNSLEQRNIAFVQYVLRSWAVAIEQEFNRKLVRPPYFCELNLNGLMRGDSKSRSEFYASGIQNGWITPNEARKFENLPPHPDGDQLFINGSLRPIDEPYTGGSDGNNQPRGTGEEDQEGQE